MSMGALEQHHPADLATYHKNPRIGDVGAIADSLRVNRQYRPIVVNRGTHTGRPMEVLAGNHTLQAFRTLAEEHADDPEFAAIDCYVIDVDNDRATRIVLADNRTAELGSHDTDDLLALLDTLDDDLEGTAYTDMDRSALRDLADGPPSLDDLADEYGEPEPDDYHDRVKLILDPVIARGWRDFRGGYDDDTDAMTALLEFVPGSAP